MNKEQELRALIGNKVLNPKTIGGKLYKELIRQKIISIDTLIKNVKQKKRKERKEIDRWLPAGSRITYYHPPFIFKHINLMSLNITLRRSLNNNLVKYIFTIFLGLKSCGHHCSMTKCCTCSDKRAITNDNKYPIISYVDGIGNITKYVDRNAFYCPDCKH